MQIRKSGRKKLDAKKLLSAVVLLVLYLLVTPLFPEEGNITTDSTTPQYESTATTQPETTELHHQGDAQTPEEGLRFAMVDVGQADGFVLECGGEVGIIDCGETDTVVELVNYLDEREITEVKFLIISHPHEDHIGGAVTILSMFDIETVYLPKVEGFSSDCYDELLDFLIEEDYTIKYIQEGDIYHLGGTTITVMEQFEPPQDEPNNYSAIMKVTFGEMDVVMTGDAETAVEKQLLQSGKDISAEVLKLGHHGSNTSTSAAFLDAVNPTYALISCGVANKHKHPTEKIMERLESREIIVYRTDECGTVVLTITATDISFNCEPGDYLNGTELKEKVRDES